MAATNIYEIPVGKLTQLGHADFSGIGADILLGGEKAPMTVMHLAVADGQGSPRHRSLEEDKVFHVASGSMVFLVGDEIFAAEAGDIIYVSRGIEHSFCATHGEATLLLVSTPSRHDRFFADMGALPVPHDPQEVQDVCERHAQVITGALVSAAEL
ncbi:MAG: cupin domain-containing protein [Erythrobacter sp.]